MLQPLLLVDTNAHLAITLTHPELELGTPAFGAMVQKHSGTGPHTLLELTLIPMETPLLRLDGTRFGLAVDSAAHPQTMESRLSVQAPAAMVYLALLTRPWMVLAVSPALIKLPVRVVLISVLSRSPRV